MGPGARAAFLIETTGTRDRVGVGGIGAGGPAPDGCRVVAAEGAAAAGPTGTEGGRGVSGRTTGEGTQGMAAEPVKDGAGALRAVGSTAKPRRGPKGLRVPRLFTRAGENPLD